MSKSSAARRGVIGAIAIGAVLVSSVSVAAAAADLESTPPTPNPLDFGNQRVGTTNSLDITMTNDGADATVGLNFTIMNDTDNEFSVVTPAPSSVAGGSATAVVSIEFAPKVSVGAGARTATLRINYTNGPGNVNIDIPLQGTATTAPEILFSQSNPFTFSDTAVGATSSMVTVDITNGGTETLDVSSISLQGPDCGVFTISLPTTPFSIPSDTPQLTATFSPTARQAYSCTVRFNSNDPADPVDFVLQGSGIGPDLVVVPPPSSISFGTVHIGDTAGPTGFDIRNDGETTATVSSIAIQGAFGSQYNLTGFTGGTIATGVTETINVQFVPTLPIGDKSDNVEILSDSVSGTILFAVSGTAAERNIAVNPTSLGFGNVTVGTNSDLTFDIQNTGGAPLTISALGLTNATDFSLVSPPPTSFQITGGGSQTITVRCAPPTVGDKAGSVTITSDGDNETSTSVPLTCRGTKPDITLNPNADINFGNQSVGVTSSPQTIVVSNANLSTTENLVLSVSIGGTNPFNFAMTPASCQAPSSCIIAPGATQNINFTFTPSQVGSRTAVATFSSNDQETPSIPINLSGTGTRPEINITTGASENFGDQRVNTTSMGRTITAENLGNEDLIISNVQITGGDSGDFAFTGPTSTTITPGSSQSWTVTFTPTAVGSRSSTFSISNNDPTGSEDPKNVPLLGNGTEVNLDVSFSPTNFPETLVGFTSDITATVTNNGGASATITNLILNNAVFTFQPSIPGLPIVLGPGAQTSFDIRFTPTMGGDINGTVTVVSDDPNSPEAFGFIGQGRVAGMSVLPTSIDYGNVRIDGSASADIVTIDNTGTSDIQVDTITLNNTTDFAFSHAGTLPIVLAPGQDLVVNVTTLPVTTGAKSATLTVTGTELLENQPLSQNVMLNSVGVIPEITLNTPVLNFGPKDVQEVGAVTELASLENTGSDDLTIDSLSITGTGASNYSLGSSVSLPIIVMPGNTTTIPVNYNPTVAANDAATLTIGHDAMGGQTDVTLSGVAIDRFISVPMTVTFPDTQRNPETPSTVNLPISNTGQAILDVFTVQKVAASDPSGVFDVADSPDDVGPGTPTDPATQNATLTFSPTAASMFSGKVEVMSDDDGLPRVEVTVEGLGFVPRMAFTPMIVDFGRTGVGIPVRASETNSGTVTITNSEDFDITIRELRVVRTDGTPGPFTVLTPLPDQPLGPGDSIEVDLEYTPTEAGNDTGRFEVLINADPTPVGMINVRGDAVTVRLRGGGCSASGDNSGAGWLAGVLLLVLLGLRRRRRAAVALAGLGALLVSAAPARADVTRNLDLRTFGPAPAVASQYQMFSIETPQIGLDKAWALGVYFNHAMNPLVVDSPEIEGMTDSPVTARTAAELAFSYAFGGKYEAGFLLPVMSQSGNAPLFSGLDPADGTAVGDLAVHGKMSLMQSKVVSLAVSATVTLPTATADQFAGANSPTTHGRGILGINAGRVQVLTNIGFRARGNGELADVEQGNELTYGVGGGYRIGDKLTAILEVFGAIGMGGGASEAVSPLEAVWGVRYRLTNQIGLSAGIGRGLMPGIGAPEFRVFTLVSYSSRARGIDPVVIPPPPKVIDRGDDDNDGIINEYDKCKNEPEDKDGFQDDDGCPDPDNDGDGLPDKADKCPNKPEDKDGYKDGDGCPDTDNDGDGIPDAKDRCPNAPEDKDGFEDSDGCPEPDNDRDGIPDLLDQCATEPETINGNKDDDGCPDKGNALVMLMPDRMETLQPVRFRGRSARISPKSRNVLGQVAAHLRAHREFLRIRIAAHVHPRNRMDMRLSLQRANAVRAWLIKWGIEPERLEVKAYGSTRPLMKKRTRAARSVNNRIEFILLEKKVERRK